MIKAQQLYDIAKCRYEEAGILLVNKKADGAVYLCGYSLELILKYKIVKVLNWDGYPENSNEFKGYQSFKVHNLDVLLKLSGLEKKIQTDNTIYARWQIAREWDSEIRYKEIGKVSESEARGIITATRDVINFIIKAK